VAVTPQDLNGSMPPGGHDSSAKAQAPTHLVQDRAGGLVGVAVRRRRATIAKEALRRCRPCGRRRCAADANDGGGKCGERRTAGDRLRRGSAHAHGGGTGYPASGGERRGNKGRGAAGRAPAGAQVRGPPAASDTERKRPPAQPKASAITQGERGTHTARKHDQAERHVPIEAPTTYRAMAVGRECGGYSSLRRGAVGVGASMRACRTTGGASGGVGGGTTCGQSGAAEEKIRHGRSQRPQRAHWPQAGGPTHAPRRPQRPRQRLGSATAVARAPQREGRARRPSSRRDLSGEVRGPAGQSASNLRGASSQPRDSVTPDTPSRAPPRPPVCVWRRTATVHAALVAPPAARRPPPPPRGIWGTAGGGHAARAGHVDRCPCGTGACAARRGADPPRGCVRWRRPPLKGHTRPPGAVEQRVVCLVGDGPTLWHPARTPKRRRHARRRVPAAARPLARGAAPTARPPVSGGHGAAPGFRRPRRSGHGRGGAIQPLAVADGVLLDARGGEVMPL